MNVLIVGCGYVGTALGEMLANQGHEVWGVRRNVDALPQSIRGVAADLQDSSGLAATFARLPAMSALVYSASPPASDEDGYARGYGQWLENTAAAVRSADWSLQRSLLVASTSVYGQTDGSWVDETSPTEPNSFRGRWVLRGEQAHRDIPAAEHAAVRLAGIYGPGRTRLIDRVRTGQTVRYAAGPHYTNRIHRRDCAGVLAHLLALSGPLESVYVGVDDAPTDHNAVVAWLAATLGVETPPERSASEAGPRMRGANKRCSNRRLRASGYDFAYPSFKEGYGALIGDASNA